MKKGANRVYPKKDFTGRKFGKWTVLREEEHEPNTTRRWICRCECGVEKPVQQGRLVVGQSTGCRACSSLVHGHSRANAPTAEYVTWGNIRKRCNDPEVRGYHRYGGRGIKVCERWLYGDGERGGFECFISDMGRKPSRKHSIDRIDNDGDYEPSNCRWATQKEQCRNQCTSVFITARGVRKNLADWAECLGTDSSVILGRLSNGWTEEAAVLTPLLPSHISGSLSTRHDELEAYRRGDRIEVATIANLRSGGVL